MMGFFSDIFGSYDFSTRKEVYTTFEDLFEVSKDYVTVEDALEIPIVNACISRISDVVGSTDIKLYKKTKDTGREEVVNDIRVKMLNTKVDNGTLNSFELKKLIVRDYFLKGHCYFYIKKDGNKLKDISYLENVSINVNSDPFNKLYTINAYDRQLRPFQTLRITRNSKNGIKGKSIIEETGLQFLLILKTMERLLEDVKRGFLPKGFFKTERNIKNIDEVKEHLKTMLKEDSSGFIFLNSNINYEAIEKKKDAENEAKAHTTELNKIAAIFGVPVSIINGGSNEEDKYNFINFTILPLLSTIESSLNRDLLLENEQGKYYFAFETKELLKGNIKERFEAYQIAIKNNIMSMDEVRDLENMKRLNLDFYKFNIADAMYYRDDNKGINMLINVNTNTAIDLNKVLDSSSDTGIMNFNPKHENDNIVFQKTNEETEKEIDLNKSEKGLNNEEGG